MQLKKGDFIVEIDEGSGFCFGVVNAIEQAEKELSKLDILYCLGDIVHNSKEVSRLEDMGLITVNHEEFKKLRDVTVLLRAHGEPPETYEIAKQNNIRLVDATCRVVINLQKKIKEGYQCAKNEGGQVVIYGKKGHAEVNGLVGQTQGGAIVVENSTDLANIDFSKPITLFAQTTKSLEGLNQVGKEIRERIDDKVELKLNDTVCRQVINRVPNLEKFVRKHECIIFVSGQKSSNGRMLYERCKAAKKNCYLVFGVEDLKAEWFHEVFSVGVCGATSTPEWLMREVAEAVLDMKDCPSS